VVGNCTRFLLLRRDARQASGEVASLAFSLHSNQPGALLEALGCFARRGLNMSRIESRPSKREMGEYIFFVDLDLDLDLDAPDGTPADPAAPAAPDPGKSSALEAALSELRPLCEHLALFGSYPLTVLA
jgi:prephenate dehydratase